MCQLKQLAALPIVKVMQHRGCDDDVELSFPHRIAGYL
jgi:hypothetical protein